MDWNFVATCGPLLLVAGALAGRPAAPEDLRQLNEVAIVRWRRHHQEELRRRLAAVGERMRNVGRDEHARA